MIKLLPLLLASLTAHANQLAGVFCTDGPYPGTTYAFSEIHGTLTVPAIAPTPSNAAIDIWLGLDGYGTATIEQIGISCYSTGGVASYALWWEMYPKNAVYEDLFAIHAGDVLAFQVRNYAQPGSPVAVNAYSLFDLSVTNLTTGAWFKTTQDNKKARSSSCVWAMEKYFKKQVCDFGTVEWRDCYAALHFNETPVEALPRNDAFTQMSNVSVNRPSNASFTLVYQP